MRNTILALSLGCCLNVGVAFALDGSDWNSAPQSIKLAEIQRVLGNVKRRGCTVRFSPQYYVKQLDDFYSDPAGQNVSFPNALGLIAMAAGEEWNC